MKKICLLGVFLFLMLIAFGCRTAYTIEGKPCRPISKSEEEFLIELARVSLIQKSIKFLTSEEQHYVMTEQPMVTIDYGGDKFGVARITWDAPAKFITTVFDGHLTNNTAKWWTEILENTDNKVLHAEKIVAPDTSQKPAIKRVKKR